MSEREKERKKIQNKRTGKTRRIVGWVLVVCGVINLVDTLPMYSYSLILSLVNTIAPLAMIAAGLWLLNDTKKNVAKWDTYDALINQNGNTPLKMVSRETGIPVDKVRSDIQKMINNGFFRDENGNNEAYIHGEYDILVMMRNGHPIEPLEKTVKEQQAQAQTEAQQAKEQGDARAKDFYADAIGRAAETIKDQDVAETMRSIEKSIRRINGKIKRNPELEDNSSVRQLKNIYLPKTMELVDKLTHEDAGPDAMLEIKGILNTCAVAYQNIVDKIYKREDEDTLIDIEVLKQTFEREGLLGSDFDIE